MKSIIKITTTMVFLLLTTAAFAQRTETRDLRVFRGVKVSQGIELVAQKGNENKVEIEASGIDLEDVVTEVRGDGLTLKIEGIHKRSKVRMTLTYTEDPDEIVVNTGADVKYKNEIKVDRLRLSANTSGSLKLEAYSETVDISAATAGHIELSGEIKNVEVGANTGASVDAYEVEAQEAYVKANTGADIRVSADDYISGRASTGGSIYYKGRPKVDMRTNTGGSVRAGR